MDGYDIFRKLIFGTSFAPAKRKKHRNKKRKLENCIAKEDTHDDSRISSGSVSSLPITAECSQSEVIGCEDGHVSTAESPKKKKKTLTLMQLTKIKKEEAAHFRKIHHIHVEGSDVPDPVQNFDQLKTDYGIHSAIISNIAKLGYTTPTPIQMQVIPLMIHERQVLACSPTGSGKTAAFLIPLLHYLKGPQNVGFRALILAPTRELVKQIHSDCLHLCEGTNLRPCVVDKVKTVEKKPKFCFKHDILISTPNRLIYMLNHDPPLVSLEKVQWFVVDESDKLFEAGEQGFRDQLAAVYKACDSAQVKRAMFSATFSHDVEQWCKLNLDSVVSVSIGARNTAVGTVKQELVFVGCESGKMIAIRDIIRKGIMPPVLIFVQSIARVRELFMELMYDGIYVYMMHAGLTQLQRDNVVKAFHDGRIWVLICTDLMARGIDFHDVNLVINYDFPTDAISYIHRIGRTGRAGKPGHAITFFTEADFANIRSIAQVMKNSGCEVPEYILKMKKKPKRKSTVALPIKRDKISTTPGYIVEKEEQKKKIIEKSKKKRQKRKKKISTEKT